MFKVQSAVLLLINYFHVKSQLSLENLYDHDFSLKFFVAFPFLYIE